MGIAGKMSWQNTGLDSLLIVIQIHGGGVVNQVSRDYEPFIFVVGNLPDTAYPGQTAIFEIAVTAGITNYYDKDNQCLDRWRAVGDCAKFYQRQMGKTGV